MTQTRTRRSAILLGVLIGLLFIVLGAWLTMRPVHATSVTVSPWAYACGHTVYGNPVTQQDLPGEASCPSGDTLGNGAADYTGGVLTVSKTGPTTDDLAAGATIGGLKTLTAASVDLLPESYCGGGAPRLNVTTADGKTHFYGCNSLTNHPDANGHLQWDLTAAGDGSGNGGVAGDDQVAEIDIVQDEQGTAQLKNLHFEGNPVAEPTPTPSPTPEATPTPTPTPTPSATASPSPSARPSATPTPSPSTAATLAQTGGGTPQDATATSALLALGLVLVGIGALTYWKRKRS